MNTLAEILVLAVAAGLVVLVRRLADALRAPVVIELTDAIAPPSQWLPVAMSKAPGFLPSIRWETEVYQVTADAGPATSTLEGRLLGDGDDYELTVSTPSFNGVRVFTAGAPLRVVVTWEDFRAKRNPVVRLLAGRVPQAEARGTRARLIAEIRRQSRKLARGRLAAGTGDPSEGTVAVPG